MTTLTDQSIQSDRLQTGLALGLRVDLWIMAALFIATLISRIPFQSQLLYHWDSVNFAYSIIDNFDVAAGQPHVPGYILFVAFARMVNVLFADPQTTMVVISLFASGLSVIALYRLGTDMLGRVGGFIGAALLATSPLIWFYGEVALPHTLDLAFVIICAWLLYHVIQGDTKKLWLAAIMLAVAGGFRPQTAVFLFPLAIFASWRVGLKIALAAVTLFGIVCLLWFVPLITLSGGLDRYLQIMSDFSAAFQTETSIFLGAGMSGVTRNVGKLVKYTLYASVAGIVPLLLWSVTNARSVPRLFKDLRFWFCVVWGLPALAFYTLIHMGQQGLIFVYLPILFLASAAALDKLRLKLRPRIWSALLGASILVGAVIFIFAPQNPIASSDLKLLTQDTIHINDAYLQSRLDTIRSEFSSDNTLIIASNWRHVEYYLPDYQIVHFRVDSEAETVGTLERPESTQRWSIDDFPSTDSDWTVILFDAELQPFASGEFETNEASTLTIARMSSEQQFRIEPNGMALENK